MRASSFLQPKGQNTMTQQLGLDDIRAMDLGQTLALRIFDWVKVGRPLYEQVTAWAAEQDPPPQYQFGGNDRDGWWAERIR